MVQRYGTPTRYLGQAQLLELVSLWFGSLCLVRTSLPRVLCSSTNQGANHKHRTILRLYIQLPTSLYFISLFCGSGELFSLMLSCYIQVCVTKVLSTSRMRVDRETECLTGPRCRVGSPEHTFSPTGSSIGRSICDVDGVIHCHT